MSRDRILEKQIAVDKLREKGFTKEQLEWLLCSTLIEGGLTLDQVAGIFDDWGNFLALNLINTKEKGE